MRFAFTLCSNNYLAQAKTLGDSLVRYNPEYQFVIGLVDRRSEDINYSGFFPHQIVAVEDIGIEEFDALPKKYNIIELNTAIKPFFFRYIFREHPNAEIVIYFDPDIMVFCDLQVIEKELTNSAVLLTPHILSPLPKDNNQLQESAFLRFGVYNLGFLAVTNKPESSRLLEWWSDHTFNECYMDSGTGLFVDQLWMNLAPILFENAIISRHPGLNAAFWNLHERELAKVDGTWVVNSSHPLVFFHFSSFNPTKPWTISPNQDRYTFETRPDLVEIFHLYSQHLMSNQYLLYRSVPCYYANMAGVHQQNNRRSDPIMAGFAAYQTKDLDTARHQFLVGIRRNPLVLRNFGILSILIESIIGSELMTRYRRWRRRTLGTIREKSFLK